MIRFVDIRDSDIAGYRFAFWDTAIDQFVRLAGDEAWDDIAELRESHDIAANSDKWNIDRLIELCPSWAHTPEVDDG